MKYLLVFVYSIYVVHVLTKDTFKPTFATCKVGFYVNYVCPSVTKTQTQWQCSQCTHWLTLQCTLVCTGTYTRVHWYYTLVDQCTTLLSQCKQV